MKTLGVGYSNSVRASFYRDSGWMESTYSAADAIRYIGCSYQIDGCIPRLPGPSPDIAFTSRI